MTNQEDRQSQPVEADTIYEVLHNRQAKLRSISELATQASLEGFVPRELIDPLTGEKTANQGPRF